MNSTTRNPLTYTDSSFNIDPMRTASPLKSSLSTIAPDLPDILSTAVLHKRRPEKHVRFALTLEPVEEDSLPSSREVSPSPVLRSKKRIIDPWRQDGPLYGAYVEYLEKQDAFTSNETQTRRTPPPPPPSAPEPGAEAPTYTHTFVIQSKSPELVIDSITVTTPPLHLPRIIHRTTKTNRHRAPTADVYFKQQLALSTAPRIIHTKKITNPFNQRNQYVSVQAALKRAELSISPTPGFHSNDRTSRSDYPLGSKLVDDYLQSRKMTEVITSPLPGTNNQINHFSDRPTLPGYSKKPRMHSRTYRTNDEANMKTPYFFQNNYNNDHLLQPVIHSND